MSTNPLGSTTPTQIGLVVPDIEAAVHAWATILGVPAPNIIITDTVDLAHTEYQGGSTPARAKLAFFPMGQITLELIQPLGEPSTWNDQLVQHGPSLHHIAFEIKGMAARTAELAEHGLKLVQRGDYTGGRYAYLDGQEKFGAVIELLEND
ncbi:MAG TPA: VOC family protein [Anaerolineales bacterium]|nr:VOC family protein [Anaerolineales bacterium]